MDGLDALTPAQVKNLAVLRRIGDPLVFNPDDIADIQAEMRSALEEFAKRIPPGQEVFIAKHRIASVLDCEVHYLEPDPFAWTPARAKGQVAHRAIQLMLSWRGEPAPAELVEEAMARLAVEERGIGEWIDNLSAGDEADLRGMSIDRVTKFVEGFPPLDPRSNPITESAARWPLTGPILFQARVDLVIGRASGNEARKVIIDLKTGRPSPRHRQDLGFYALLETLIRSVPPRKVATFYLDSAETQVEDVSERLLRTAVRRTLDGVNAVIELDFENRSPIKRPGTSCRWCPLSDDCAEGQAHLIGHTGNL